MLLSSLASHPYDLDAAKKYQAAKRNGIATVHAGCNREPNMAKLTKHHQGLGWHEGLRIAYRSEDRSEKGKDMW
jgi:hypothetical protein